MRCAVRVRGGGACGGADGAVGDVDDDGCGGLANDGDVPGRGCRRTRHGGVDCHGCEFRRHVRRCFGYGVTIGDDGGV